jgi:hypothetical protein
MSTLLVGLLTITTIPSLGAPAFWAVRMEFTVRTSAYVGAAASARQQTPSKQTRIGLFMRASVSGGRFDRTTVKLDARTEDFYGVLNPRR